MVADQRVDHAPRLGILRHQGPEDSKRGVVAASPVQHPRLERQQARFPGPIRDQRFDQYCRFLRLTGRQPVLHQGHPIPESVHTVPGEPDGFLERVVGLLVLSDLFQRLRETGEDFPAAAGTVRVLRELDQSLELLGRSCVLAAGGEHPAERQSRRDAAAVLLQQPHQGRFRFLELTLLPPHHRQTHEGDFTAGLRREDPFEGLGGVVQAAQAGQTVRQGQPERLIVGMVGGSLLVERDDFGEGLHGRPARDLAIAQEVVDHLARIRLPRFDAKRLQQVVERLFPVAGAQTELREQQQLDESVRGAADDLAQVHGRFLTALHGGEQTSQLGAAPKVLGIEADRLAQRSDRALRGFGIVSRPKAPEVHRAEHPVGGGGVRIPLHRFRGGRFGGLQVARREAEVGDFNERIDRLDIEFGRPPVGGDRLVTLTGHLRETAFAEHPVGLGDGIDRDRIVSGFLAFGLFRGLLGGNGFLGAVALAGKHHEQRQQHPHGPGHEPGNLSLPDGAHGLERRLQPAPAAQSAADCTTLPRATAFACRPITANSGTTSAGVRPAVPAEAGPVLPVGAPSRQRHLGSQR